MNKKTVLIVDDDKITRNLLENELKRNFFKTFQATCGREALEIFNKQDIDIMVLDIKLPDMDGLEILKRIKEKKQDCEAIVITGFGTQEIAVQSLRRGAIDYIEKPIKIDEFSTALGRALEKITLKENISYKNTLLVIDDEEEIVIRLKNILEKENYEVFTAFNGKKGLNIIINNKIDVIITYIKMGDMDGIEVIKKAKTFRQDIEGIIITGYKEQELAIKSLRAGAIDYLVKPINLDELLFSIKKAIERINLKRTSLYRNRELIITSEIISKMNEELERRIQEKTKDISQIQAQLFQTSKLATLGEMATGIAHELNQPLGGISLIATQFRKLIARDNLTQKEIESGLKDIEISVKRMSKIIRHIRTFARQDKLKFILVNVNETINSALNLLGEQLRMHEIKVIKKLSSYIPQINGEPYQLEQVWINIITNARDALDQKKEQTSDYRKKITIYSIYNNESKIVEIIYKDNGMGMSEQVREKAFEPFFTTKEVGKATGLGLSISYGIIKKHKGNIEIKSQQNKGTTLKVYLPAGNNDDQDINC